MLLSKSFKFRLKTKSVHEEKFYQWSGSCRYIFNHFLSKKIKIYEEDQKSLSYADMANELPEMKKELEWLREPPAQILQQSLKDLDQAYKNFFRRVKSGENPGFPKFKKKFQHNSFRLPEPKHIKVEGDRVQLPKFGWIRFWKSREIEGRLRNVTITEASGKWYISFNCEVEKEIPENTGMPIGIDRGVKHTLTFSEPTKISGQISPFADLPEERLKEIDIKLRNAQRYLARKKKFSSNWRKQKKKISALHIKISNIRNDFLHKVSTDISKNHGYIFLEKLNVKNMTKSAKGTIEYPGKNVKVKSNFNRMILSQGWQKFQSLLEYKSIWYGSNVVYVDPKYTSQKCRICGYVDKLNRKNQKLFICESCGHTENADINAANNILTVGLTDRACGDTALAGR